MDTGKLFQPIAVAKPIRGREMRTTVMPKDMISTVKAASGKSEKDNSLKGTLQKQSEKDVEVYHEGYIDGKLYLVPDSNLQAMRDIINIKMKRRHSSGFKPKTSLNEPTQYHEFTSKLDTLLEKIDKLAVISDDEISYESRVNEEGSVDLRTEVIDERLKANNYIEYEETGEKKYLIKPTKGTTESDHTSGEEKIEIPPMLDENIKYKRVKPKKQQYKKISTDLESLPISKGKIYDSIEDESNEVKQSLLELLSNKTDFEIPVDDEIGPHSAIDTFRLLISGHLKEGTTPVFIVLHNYTGSKILENQDPDFKSHKKEGNIDIFITGKFFTDHILREKTLDSPAFLSIEPHKILISSETNLHRDKFKNIYNVGPIDIALEGEFVRSEVTSQYTPVLSLEILKQETIEEDTGSRITDGNKQSTTVLYNRQTQKIPFHNKIEPGILQKNKQPHTHKEHKRVHYASENRDSKFEGSPSNNEKKLEPIRKGLIDKIKENILYKKLFFKEVDISRDIKSENELKSTVLDIVKSKRGGKSLQRKSNSKRRKTKHNKNKRIIKSKDDSVMRSNSSFSVYTANEESTSAFILAEDSISEKVSVTTDPSEKSKKIRLTKKKRKQDKNQAIIENPILAQMQEFFIA